jgi:outer membrane receptor protein involved in Fe transport
LNYRVNNNVQLYLYNGRGFHSNDTRVAVQQGGKKVLPPAYGTDLGGIFKVGKKLVLQSALWYLWLDQEFIYVGDEGIVEPGGKTKRVGFDVSARYEIVNNLFADVDVSIANPRALDVAKRKATCHWHHGLLRWWHHVQEKFGLERKPALPVYGRSSC